MTLPPFFSLFRIRQYSTHPYRPMNIHEYWMVLWSRISFFFHFHFFPLAASFAIFSFILMMFNLQENRFYSEGTLNDWHPLSRIYDPQDIKSLYQLDSQTSWIYASSSKTSFQAWVEALKPQSPYAIQMDDPEINSLDWSLDLPPHNSLDKLSTFSNNDFPDD